MCLGCETDRLLEIIKKAIATKTKYPKLTKTASQNNEGLSLLTLYAGRLIDNIKGIAKINVIPVAYIKSEATGVSNSGSITRKSARPVGIVPVDAPKITRARWNWWSTNILEHIQGMVKNANKPATEQRTVMGSQYCATTTIEIEAIEAVTIRSMDIPDILFIVPLSTT